MHFYRAKMENAHDKMETLGATRRKANLEQWDLRKNRGKWEKNLCKDARKWRTESTGNKEKHSRYRDEIRARWRNSRL